MDGSLWMCIYISLQQIWSSPAFPSQRFKKNPRKAFNFVRCQRKEEGRALLSQFSLKYFTSPLVSPPPLFPIPQNEALELFTPSRSLRFCLTGSLTLYSLLLLRSGVPHYCYLKRISPPGFPEELHEVTRKSAALQMQQFVGEEKNDLQDYLRSLQSGPPQRVLSGFLHSFVNSNAQVNALLSSLDIDGDTRARGPLPGRFRELDYYWNESQGMMKLGPHAADGWVAEYTQRRVEHGGPNAWAHSFEQQHGTYFKFGCDVLWL